MGSGTAEEALVRQVFEALNQGGVEAAIEFAAERVELRDDGLITPPTEMHGSREIVDHMRLYEGSFADLHYEPLEFLCRGEAIVVPTHVTGRGSSGPFELLLTAGVWVQGSRVTRARIFRTREDALRELPVSNPSPAC